MNEHRGLTVGSLFSPVYRAYCFRYGGKRSVLHSQEIAISLTIVSLILSGCGGAHYRYYKPGVSQQQMLQDGFECKQMSRQQYIVGSGGLLVGGSEPTFEVWKECLEARGYSVTKESEDINEQAAAVEGQWLYGEYTWLLVEKKAIDDSAAILNSDRSDTPQRRDALAVHLQRLEEYKRRLSVYEQRRAASSSVYK